MARLEHPQQHSMVSSHALITILYEINTTTTYDFSLGGLSRFRGDNPSLSLSARSDSPPHITPLLDVPMFKVELAVMFLQLVYKVELRELTRSKRILP